MTLNILLGIIIVEILLVIFLNIFPLSKIKKKKYSHILEFNKIKINPKQKLKVEFIEPVTFKEKFDEAHNISDFIKN